MADTFTGFPPGGIAFLAGLAADNAKTYFNANRDTYTNDLAAPLRALVVAVGERLRDTTVPDVCFEPSVGKSLFRINRDTRFSADKTPYHPWVDAIWWAGPDDARRAPAFIFRLSADHLVAGAGIMGLRDTRLDRYRAAVADNSSGHALDDLLTQLSTTLRGVEITTPTRERVPAPYPQDHPRRDLLRCDTLHASVRRPHPPTLASPAFADTLTDLLTPFAQLHHWLVDHVAT
ncbi:MAG TPA: DUF2461 domain-containing protein [Streptosporangiaceae bacterium]|nr:DUF2461 domain-containing protein [Streptosporangiaceae bacterium]